MNTQWYIINVIVGTENRISREINHFIEYDGLDEIEKVLIPKEKIFEFSNGELIEKEKNFFPGYIFVKMILTDKVKQMISSMGRNASFLNGPNPPPVKEAEMARIFKTLEESSKKPSFAFAVGDKVFGSREITIVEQSFINDANATETYSNKFTFVVNSTPSTQTGGGYFVFGGPVNDRA